MKTRGWEKRTEWIEDHGDMEPSYRPSPVILPSPNLHPFPSISAWGLVYLRGMPGARRAVGMTVQGAEI
jgi:hypothetical protein